MFRSLKKSLLFATIFLALVGCSQMPRPTIVLKPSPSEVALQQLNAKQQKDIEALDKRIKELSETFKVNFDANISLGSASVMSVYDTMLADSDKDQFDLAEMAGLEVAIKALPAPTLKDYRMTSETQRKLLSQQAEEIAKGKKEIEAQKKAADESKEAQRKAEEERDQIEADKITATNAFRTEKERLNGEIIKEKDAKTIEAELRVKEAADKKELQALIVKILMVVGVVAGIAAIVLKSPTAGLASAGAIGLAISVSFLPLWGLVVGLVGVFALIAGPIFYQYHEKNQALKNVVGATQEYKDANPEAFKSGLAQNLQEWNKDSKTAKVIDKTLKELNLK